MAEDRMTLARLEELVDRHGADFGRWPGAGAAQAARRLVLADPDARALHDEAKRLDAALDARTASLEAWAAETGLAERTLAAVMPELPPRRSEVRLWTARLAASFLIAAVIGGGFDRLFESRMMPAEAEVVMLDAVLYGPGEVELR